MDFSSSSNKVFLTTSGSSSSSSSTPSSSIFLLILLLCPLILTSAQMAIPKRSPGFVYKNSDMAPSSVVTLTAFLDFTCKDSQRAFPTLLDVADKLAGKNFELIVHSFSLPYHRNSHLITAAAHLINTYTEGYRVFPFIAEMFQNLDSFTTFATRNMSDEQVIDALTPVVIRSTCVSRSTFTRQIQNVTYDHEAQLDFKHGCTRGVYKTPTFMLNDVVVFATPTWSLKKWISLINSLL